MKIIFFGSPAYSIPIIDQIKTLDYDLLGVVTQNDQKIRRRKILKTAVYSYCLSPALLPVKTYIMALRHEQLAP